MVEKHPDSAAAVLHDEALVLDAAVPLVNPRTLKTFLPVLRQGGVDAILTTVASLEDCRWNQAKHLGRRLSNSGRHPAGKRVFMSGCRHSTKSNSNAPGYHKRFVSRFGKPKNPQLQNAGD